MYNADTTTKPHADAYIELPHYHKHYDNASVILYYTLGAFPLLCFWQSDEFAKFFYSQNQSVQ